MRALTGIGGTMMRAAAARNCASFATVLAVVLGSGPLGQGHAASDAEWHKFEGLVSAAYFSESCQHEAGLLGIARTSDARYLVAAFAQSEVASTPDARAERRAGWPDGLSGGASCAVPAVALTNLLRQNGIAAELVLVWTQQEGPATIPALPDKVDGVLVYVPVLDRYVDPAATDMRENKTFDRGIRETAVRVHLIAPAPDAVPALDRCRDICISEYWPRRDPYRVPVKTEAIRAP